LFMAYTGKTTFKIDGITIHWSISIPLNYKDLPSFNLERLDNLIKKYDQLQLIVLDEISLIGKIISKYINLWWRSIKHIHTKFFGNLDVIIIGDFYQVQLVCDAKFFKINVNNIINSKFLDGKKLMLWIEASRAQSDEQFINILNQFQIITQLQSDVDTINNQCFCTPPNDPKFPYLFYTNETKKNWFSFKMKGMYSYCVHKINIMIHVLNNFNYKMMQTSH
jgi:hypothetical protein